MTFATSTHETIVGFGKDATKLVVFHIGGRSVARQLSESVSINLHCCDDQRQWSLFVFSVVVVVVETLTIVPLSGKAIDTVVLLKPSDGFTTVRANLLPSDATNVYLLPTV